MGILEKRAKKFVEQIFPLFLTREAAMLKVIDRDVPQPYRGRFPHIVHMEKDSRGYVQKLWTSWLRNGGQPITQLQFAKQAAELLHVLHDRINIIHLDLRMDNIESEVLTPADEAHHVDEWKFTVPFAAPRSWPRRSATSPRAGPWSGPCEAGTGNVVEATRHMRSIRSEIARLHGLPEEELFTAAKELGAPNELVAEAARAAPAARRPVHRGRPRHPGRRRADDATRRRGSVRRLGHLQVRRPG